MTQQDEREGQEAANVAVFVESTASKRGFLCIFFHALQRTNAENSKQIFPEKELRGHNPNFHIPVSVNDLYIPTFDLPILLQEICGPILGIYTSHMNVEIGTEAA